MSAKIWSCVEATEQQSGVVPVTDRLDACLLPLIALSLQGAAAVLRGRQSARVAVSLMDLLGALSILAIALSFADKRAASGQLLYQSLPIHEACGLVLALVWAGRVLAAALLAAGGSVGAGSAAQALPLLGGALALAAWPCAFVALAISEVGDVTRGALLAVALLSAAAASLRARPPSTPNALSYSLGVTGALALLAGACLVFGRAPWVAAALLIGGTLLCLQNGLWLWRYASPGVERRSSALFSRRVQRASCQSNSSKGEKRFL